MSENPNDYGWFIRSAKNPMSIRTLDGIKVAIPYYGVVFHKKKYLEKMPGFSFLPNMDTNNPKHTSLVKVWPPQHLQFLSITPSAYSEVSFHELDITNMGSDEETSQEMVEYDEHDGSDDRNEHEHEDKIPVDLIENVDGDSNKVENKSKVSTDKQQELIAIRKEFKDFDNRKWVSLKKEDIEKYLKRLNVSCESSNKWDKLKILKGLLQE